MRISLRGAHVAITDRLRAYTEYRLFTNVLGHGAIVRSADVVLRRKPPGHGPFLCTIGLDLDPSGRIKTQARGAHPGAAIDRAIERAAWLLERRVRDARFQGEMTPFTS